MSNRPAGLLFAIQMLFLLRPYYTTTTLARVASSSKGGVGG